ncbi:MAG: AAA family ATPase [Helicobacteraceae bacterium]|jgi:DNA transposition AAA+ family ATPase|nr:AAA family ATPase [Helicobacteraceae bacterium]
MNDSTTPTLKQEVERWIELNKADGVSQASIARATGYAAGVISQVVAAKYAGDAASVERKIRQYIANYGAKAKTPEIWIDTKQTRAAAVAVTNAIAENRMCALFGDSGAGKTSFIRRYLADRPNNVYLEIVRGQGTRDVLREICAGLKIQPKRSNYQTFCEICAHIGDRVIVIDQAEFLRSDTMEMIRGINDRSGAAVILIGIHSLLNVLSEHEHFRRRIKWKWQFQPLNDDEIGALCEAYGVSRSFAQTIAKLAQRNFRSTTYLLENAVKIANGEPITEDLLIDAKQMLFI